MSETMTVSVGQPPADRRDRQRRQRPRGGSATRSLHGSATDAQDGTLPASALSWDADHASLPVELPQHPIQTFTGVASGSFAAPDHEYPSHLELDLTATDSSGLTSTELVQLEPQTVSLTFASNPTGCSSPSAADADDAVPRTVIAGRATRSARRRPGARRVHV